MRGQEMICNEEEDVMTRWIPVVLLSTGLMALTVRWSPASAED